MPEDVPSPFDLEELIEHVWVVAALASYSAEVADPLNSATVGRPERAQILAEHGLSTSDDTAEIARSRANALRATLLQALTAAESSPQTTMSWNSLPDEAIISQGNASRVTGLGIAERVVPGLPGLTEMLTTVGARILDVGTGVGTIASVLADKFPAAHVTAIDILPRVLTLARARTEGAPGSDRITFVEQNVGDLAEMETFDLIWLPAPFIHDEILPDALGRVMAALQPGGWLVVGTNPLPTTGTGRSIGRWRSVLTGGSTAYTDEVEQMLSSVGGTQTQRFATVPGGPVLIAATTQTT